MAKDDSYYENQINLFHEWADTNNLSTASTELLWFKLIQCDNKNGWKEWFEVSSAKLAYQIHASRQTLVKDRQALVDAGLIEYRPGNRGKLGRYRIIPLRLDESTGLINPGNKTV